MKILSLYRFYLLILISLFMINCQSNEPSQENTEDQTKALSNTIEAVTLLGDTLYSPEISPGTAYDNYQKAEADYTENPGNIDNIIWYGRRTAYLGHYQKAIDIYSQGIKLHPDEARLYRHRGHRYISTRQYDKAIADFEKAVALTNGQPDQVEPDGLPNAKNIPLTTLQSNIWYHLGLAYYLKNDLDNALNAFNNRTVTQKYDDNIVSGGHWQYMILRRQNQEEGAKAAIQSVTKDMDIIENMSYHKTCLFYKGLLDEADLQPDGVSSSADDVLDYALGNWYLYDQQDTIKAKKYYQKLLSDGNPFSFAYLAAEADWSRVFVD